MPGHRVFSRFKPWEIQLRRLAGRLTRKPARMLVGILPDAVLCRSLSFVRFAERFQMSAQAMDFVREHLPAGGSLLVFGVGRDSTTWAMVNKGGRTAFVEDDPDWLAMTRERSPALEIHHVTYKTTVEASARYQDQVEIPLPPLPPSLQDVTWDVIVVDGPRGNEPNVPGRASSILLAARLARPGGWVLVDDCHRGLEQHLTAVVFGREPDLVIDRRRAGVAAFNI